MVNSSLSVMKGWLGSRMVGLVDVVVLVERVSK